jgi:protein-L-isoaspartate O-methyltransferase
VSLPADRPRLHVPAAAVVLAAAVLGTTLAAQTRHPVSGRVIAPVMSAAGAPWLERPEREAEEAPSLAIKALKVQPGQVVADIGAGSGYYTVRLARAVGAKGHVFATDIQTAMLDLLRANVAKAGLENVTTVLGAPDDPRLPPASIDLAIMVDVYHELAAPQAFLRRLRPALKKDGRLVLLEFRKEDRRIPILEVHKMSVAEVRQELEPEGYRLAEVLNDLPWQHILVLRLDDRP